MKLWDSLRSVLSAKRGYPYISGTIQLPIKTTAVKPTSRWQYIVIHHSFSRDDLQTRNWDAIRNYHICVNGWKMVGYHMGVEMHNGKLDRMPGRPLDMDGAHAIGFNRNGLGICLVGNYDSESPSEERLRFVADLCKEWQIKFSIPRRNVIGHRETYLLRGVKVEKTCPGSKFDMDKFRLRLYE